MQPAFAAMWFDIGLWCAGLVGFVAGGTLVERFARRHRRQAFFSVGLVLVYIAFSAVVRGHWSVAAAVLAVPLAIWTVRRAGPVVGALALAGLGSVAWSGHGVVAVPVRGVVLRLLGMHPGGGGQWVARLVWHALGGGSHENESSEDRIVGPLNRLWYGVARRRPTDVPRWM